MTLLFQEKEYPQGEYVEDVLGDDGDTHFIGLLSRRRGQEGIARYMGSINGIAAKPPIDIAPNQTAPIPGVRAAGKRSISISGR